MAPSKTFKTADGTVVKFKHPFLSGQIGPNVDCIDVSRASRLNELYLEKQVVLCDVTFEIRGTGKKLEMKGCDLHDFRFDSIPMPLVIQEGRAALEKKGGHSNGESENG